MADEFPIRAGDVLVVFSKEPSVHYKVGRVEEDGQYFLSATQTKIWVKKTEAEAIDLARILARNSACRIFFKDAKTGEWREIIPHRNA